MLPADFNWQRPDYVPVYRERERRLTELRKDPQLMKAVKRYYATHPNGVADFINDWGMTSDTRNADIGLPVVTPFVLFPKQRDWVQFIMTQWAARKPGLTEKSRDGGLSWLAMSVACTVCLFRRNVTIGFGSRKEEYVDKLGAPKSLFYKGRMFMKYLPPDFLDGWDIAKHAPHMRIEFPGTESVITGEAGDSIGRGDRASIYFVDEAAHLEHPELIDSSLSATTNCRQDISSVKGRANPFAIKRWGGKVDVFTFSWRDDPRKDQEWYDKKAAELDPVTVAQEIDMNYDASVEGVVIPAAWVQAAVGLHEKLGITPTGLRRAALDVADQGKDKNAMAIRRGILLEYAESWSGKESDILATTSKAFRICDERGLEEFEYDADGLGAGVRGDARSINEGRTAIDPATKRAKGKAIKVAEYRGSSSPMFPERIVPGTNRTNEDFYLNRKAQAWWTMRFRFQQSYRAAKGEKYDPENIISIARDIPELQRLLSELSQATVKETANGKLQIEKTPDGAMSPNLGDACVMAFAPRNRPFNISEGALAATK